MGPRFRKCILWKSHCSLSFYVWEHVSTCPLTSLGYAHLKYPSLHSSITLDVTLLILNHIQYNTDCQNIVLLLIKIVYIIFVFIILIRNILIVYSYLHYLKLVPYFLIIKKFKWNEIKIFNKYDWKYFYSLQIIDIVVFKNKIQKLINNLAILL